MSNKVCVIIGALPPPVPDLHVGIVASGTTPPPPCGTGTKWWLEILGRGRHTWVTTRKQEGVRKQRKSREGFKRAESHFGELGQGQPSQLKERVWGPAGWLSEQIRLPPSLMMAFGGDMAMDINTDPGYSGDTDLEFLPNPVFTPSAGITGWAGTLSIIQNGSGLHAAPPCFKRNKT